MAGAFFDVPGCQDHGFRCFIYRQHMCIKGHVRHPGACKQQRRQTNSLSVHFRVGYDRDLKSDGVFYGVEPKNTGRRISMLDNANTSIGRSEIPSEPSQMFFPGGFFRLA